MRLVDSPETSYAAVGALAAVGRDNAEVRQLIIDRAKPGPPKMMQPPDFPQYEYDLTMRQRGVAIDAMRYFSACPEDCIPVLIDAIDTFVEFDPDQSHGGPPARISQVLELFGARAGAAAVPLARHLEDVEGDWPRCVLNALAAMGPAAAEAILLLEAYRLSRGISGSDDENDPVAVCIRRVNSRSDDPSAPPAR